MYALFISKWRIFCEILHRRSMFLSWHKRGMLAPAIASRIPGLIFNCAKSFKIKEATLLG